MQLPATGHSSALQQTSRAAYSRYMLADFTVYSSAQVAVARYRYAVLIPKAIYNVSEYILKRTLVRGTCWCSVGELRTHDCWCSHDHRHDHTYIRFMSEYDNVL